ncbi:MAG TPA: glutathione peroxidase [Verrucomicrobiae bacterium]|jgi:glutathione peroxidase
MKRFLMLAALVCASLAFAEKMSSLYDIPLKDIHGKDASLKAWQGKVLLIVNVASQCGYTPQYSGLEALHRKYKDRGLVVLGFPCNQFGGQEPGSEAEILKFCKSNYDVTFPLFGKIDVKGPNQHPLYATLTGKSSPFPGNVKWNFAKVLVGRDGKIIKRFDSGDEPDSNEVTRAIETALAAK